jgi:hypothetical protein
MRTIAITTLVLGLVTASSVAEESQQRFSSPDAAIRALETAARDGDSTRILAVLGPDGEDIVASGDDVEDAAARKRFTTAAAQRKRIERADDGATAIVHLGNDDWPFPIPLVRDGDGWRFDTAAGKDELLNRRIGRNELTAISVGRAYVDAQQEFYARFREYARKFLSTPGKQDGLYWEASGGDESPFGPMVASATAEGYHHAEADADAGPEPYHGYYFRILTKQGKHAPGGARDYVKDGRMTGGFALIAWPADHGSSGVMTFMVGEQGVVFQKDLGQGTTDAVKAITAYDPDDSWEPTR